MCLSPVAITRECAGRKYTEHVPCGKCNECIKDKQNEYVVRTLEESMKRGNVWFFTLTYAPENVPIKFDLDGEVIEEDPETGEVFYADSAKILSLNTDDIKSWKKRVRERINKRRKKEGKDRIDFSYLICGEYGPKTHRPHYHGLFIGLDKEYIQEFKEDWEKHFGFTQFNFINTLGNEVEATAKYVAKYVCKMKDLEDENVLNGKVEKPRKQVSVGYGMPTRKRFDAMRKYHLANDLFPDMDIDDLYEVYTNGGNEKVKQVIRQIIKRRKYKTNGKEYKLPNYYKRKLFYIKDAYTGKVRASQLQRLVSKTMELDIRKDYSRKLCELASNFQNSDSPEAYFEASRMLSDSEKRRREEISQALYETNIAALRKSRF